MSAIISGVFILAMLDGILGALDQIIQQRKWRKR